MGVAVLDGRELIYYGVKDFREKRPTETLTGATRQVLFRLIEAYGPAVLAYEKSFYVQSRQSALLRAQEQEIQRVAKARGVKLVGYSPMSVRKALCHDGWARKRDVATVLTRRYPELARYLSEPRLWQRGYWENMFDAVAVAVVCADEVGTADTPGSRSQIAA